MLFSSYLLLNFCFLPYSQISFLLLQDDARQKYADLVSSLVSAESASQKEEASPEEGRHDGYETLIVTTKNNITKIMFNRPDRKNAINHQVKKLTWED